MIRYKSFLAEEKIHRIFDMYIFSYSGVESV